MKKLIFISLSVLVLAACGAEEKKTNENNQNKPEQSAAVDQESGDTDRKEKGKEPKRKSPREIAKYMDRDFNVILKYGSPRVRGRVIWGGLVPYDTVWRAGANETTAIEFTKDVKIKDELIKAGTYGFFIIPKKDQPWVVILNKEWSKELHDAWGAFNYKEEKDVARFEVKPHWNNKSLEALMYAVNEEEVVFQWEKAVFTLPYKVQN